MRVFVNYFYEVETLPDTPASNMSSEILPKLEVAFIDALLPSLFDDCVIQGRSRNLVDGTSNEGMLGISAFPSDVVTNAGCEEETNGNNCVFVDGRLSLFVDGAPALHSEIALETLKNGMESDQFLSADPALQKVTFVIFPDDNPIETDDELINDDEDDDPIGFFAGSVILAAAVGLGLALTLCLTVGRRRPNNAATANRRYSKRRRGSRTGEDAGSSENNYEDWAEEVVSADDNTVRISNKDDTDMRVNVDLEIFSDDESNVGNICFDFFDMILEGTSNGKKEKKNAVVDDDISAVSF